MDYNARYQGVSFAVVGNSYLMAKVPQSCCAAAVDQVRRLQPLLRLMSLYQDTCMVTPTAANGAFVQGCFALVQSQIEHHINVLGGVSIAVIVIMVSVFFWCMSVCNTLFF